MRRVLLHAAGAHVLLHARWSDAAILVVATVAWAAIAKVILDKAGSALPAAAMRQLKLR
jgi:hypothetical protein